MVDENQKENKIDKDANNGRPVWWVCFFNESKVI